MNHQWHNRIPQTGKIHDKCKHCRKGETRGTHGGCHECGKVRHTANGRRKRAVVAE